MAVPLADATDAAAAPGVEPVVPTPGTCDRATQLGIPSYQARSLGLSEPAASWRFTSSSENGPIRCPSRATWICMRRGCDKKNRPSQAVWRQTGAITPVGGRSLIPQKLAQSGLIGGRFG